MDDMLPCQSCQSTDLTSDQITGKVSRWTCRACHATWYSADPTGIPIRTRRALTRLSGGAL